MQIMQMTSQGEALTQQPSIADWSDAVANEEQQEGYYTDSMVGNRPWRRGWGRGGRKYSLGGSARDLGECLGAWRSGSSNGWLLSSRVLSLTTNHTSPPSFGLKKSLRKKKLLSPSSRPATSRPLQTRRIVNADG